MAIKLTTGFSIGSQDLIDDRLVLSKAQMLALNENTYPEHFFCLCSDDNKIYVYNSSNTPNDVTGKFVVYVGTDGTTGVSIDDTQASSTTTYSSNKIEADYQKINDNILTTNNKTIVGSINELNEEIGSKGFKPIPESYVKVYRNILEQPNGKITNGNKCTSTIGEGMMYLPKTDYVLYHIKNNDVIENSLQDGHTYTLTYNSDSNATVEYFIFDYAVDSMDIKCIAKETVTSGTKITMPTNSYWFQMNTLKSDNITNISLVDDAFPYDNIRLVVADGNVSDTNTQIAVSTIGDIASVGEYIKLIPETIGMDSTGIYKYIDDKVSSGGVSIDDTHVRTDATYSSDKISNLILQATDGGAVIDDTTISSATVFSSEKTNTDYVSKINLEGLVSDKGFIKNTVDNLINYYNKTESYSKDEVNNIIGNLNKLDAQIVASLPTENISTSTIYLIEAEPTGSGIYNQYMYINNEWASLGSTAIDLTEYVKNTDLATVATSGSYNDLSDTPTIPTKVSQLTNDSGFTTIDDNSETATTTTLSANKINSMINNKIDAGIGSKANQTDLDNHKDDTTIHITKAEKDKLVTTDDVTDTIDINSSGTKIPNVKAIYNDIIEGKSIDQTVIDTCGTEILKYPLGIWRISSDNIANNFADLPLKTSGRMEITSIDTNTNKNPWNSSWSYRVYNFETYTDMNYFRKVTTSTTAGIISTDTGWQKVCTTKVPDVGTTTITPVNGAITGTIEYTVNKGICYVSLFNVKSTINDNNLSISTTMPKPAINSSSAIVKQEGNGNIGFVYINKNTTQLKANIYIAGIIANCNFSYPVAEE